MLPPRIVKAGMGSPDPYIGAGTEACAGLCVNESDNMLRHCIPRSSLGGPWTRGQFNVGKSDERSRRSRLVL